MRHLFLALSLLASIAFAEGSKVLVVYNANVPESLAVANYYASRRAIPAANLCPLTQLTQPMENTVNLSQYQTIIKPQLQACLNAVGKSSILYIVFTYRTPFRMGGIALDSLVADVWNQVASDTQNQFTNPYFAAASNKTQSYTPFKSFSDYRLQSGAPLFYLVFRLDAPSQQLATRLVDLAIQAEKNGHDGQGCFDRRMGDINQVVDSGYGVGDWDIYQAARFTNSAGFYTTEDAQATEFGTAPAPLRCENASFYAGWYTYRHQLVCGCHKKRNHFYRRSCRRALFKWLSPPWAFL